MSFTENDYLAWYMPRMMRHDGSINLHASGVPSLTPQDLNVPDGDPWEMDRRFEAALAEWLGIPPEEVLFTPGATGGTLLALLALARSGSEALVESPIYEPMLRQAGRLNPVRRLYRNPRDRWRLPMEEARSAIGRDTAIVMITEPHNPSGVLSPREDVLELARAAARHRAIVLVNEVYRGYTHAPSYHAAADNIVVVSSLSKLCGAYWARLGWLSGRPELVRRLRMAHMNLGMATRCAGAIGLAVLDKIDGLVERARGISAQGIPIVDAWVRAHSGYGWNPPDGPGYGCIKLPGNVDDLALAERLHDEGEVLLVPGTFFEAPGMVRVSWIQSGTRLEEGLDHLARAVATPAV
ncbi:MAG: aminotransferase class I/II-fold pyridoxal phosphate-dependent enzyme [Deltaproteobacteria bacterium]|nr:aminotransferase class I/II-fold pyridoxal phosphate-dependent enzyme [Deltaproteobacteria bacterium]